MTRTSAAIGASGATRGSLLLGTWPSFPAERLVDRGPERGGPLHDLEIDHEDRDVLPREEVAREPRRILLRRHEALGAGPRAGRLPAPQFLRPERVMVGEALLPNDARAARLDQRSERLGMSDAGEEPGAALAKRERVRERPADPEAADAAL